MRRYLLYGYGGAYNHGAEAIVRTTVAMLRQSDAPILLSTHFPDQDREFGIDELVDLLIPADLSWIKQERQAKTLGEKEVWAKHMYRKALEQIDQDTVCVGIGGDNYCYSNWYRQSIFHKTAKDMGAVSFLWGCSIQPEMIDAKMEAVLQGHDHIYVRESETEHALCAHGILHQVTRLPDPAFFLNPSPIPLPDGFVPGETVAVNLSPLILRRNSKVLDCFVDAIHCLLDRAENLLLVPHVTMPADDDRQAIGILQERLSLEKRNRVLCLEGSFCAAELKYAISQCSLLLCTRTHASIASYSTCVPTLVVGYSIKSVGLGRDMDMSHWVLPLEMCEELPKRVAELWECRQEVREALVERMAVCRLQWETGSAALLVD